MNIYLVIAIVFLIFGHIFKNLRWQQIIKAYEEVDIDKLLQIMSIGQGINMVIPFRIGDLARIFMLGKRHLKNGYVLALASVVSDIFIDTVTVGLAFVSLYALGIHRDEVCVMAIGYGLLSLILPVICVAIVLNKKVIKKWIYKLATIFNEDIERKLLMATYTIFSSIKKLFNRNKIIKLVLFTIGTWCGYFLSYAAFALFLQHLQYDFTLTKVFKTIFAMSGNSLFVECVKGQNGTGWGIWFFIYLCAPLIIIFVWVSVRKKARQRNRTAELKYRSILPQLRPAERLAFLSMYFNSDENEYIESYLEINKDVSVLEDYSSGSNATTILCMNNEGIFFRKYAFGEDAEKLWKQFEWLKRNSAILSVAKIVRERKTDQFSYYDMEYANEATGFFKFIHTSSLEDSWGILEEVLSELEKKLYIVNRRSCDKTELSQYIDFKVNKNMYVCEKWAQNEYKGLWEAEKVYINGVPYHNLNYYTDMLSRDKLIRIFENDVYAEIHGDLTIENIICRHGREKGSWYLIDSNNGQMHETPFLDLAKLLQSLHGRYEFLMMVDSVQIKDNQIEFLFTYSMAYRKLYKKYHEYLEENFSRKEIKSIYYHEIVHWLRLMPYKIKKNPEKAIIFYAGLLMILNDVEKMFDDEKETGSV